MAIVQGYLSKLPPALNTSLTAAIPAPIRIPAFNASGTKSTTLFASPVAPNMKVTIPNSISNAIKACMRSTPSTG